MLRIRNHLELDHTTSDNPVFIANQFETSTTPIVEASQGGNIEIAQHLTEEQRRELASNLTLVAIMKKLFEE